MAQSTRPAGDGLLMTIDELYYQRRLDSARSLLEAAGQAYADCGSPVMLQIMRDTENEIVYYQARLDGHDHKNAQTMAYNHGRKQI